MDFKGIYGMALGLSVFYTAIFHLRTKYALGVNRRMIEALIIKVGVNLLNFIACFNQSALIENFKYLLVHVFATLFLYCLMNISKGCLFYNPETDCYTLAFLLSINASLLLYEIDHESFSVLLVLCNGTILIFMVNRNLRLMNLLYAKLDKNEEIAKGLLIQVKFLGLLYVYFINEIARICLAGILNKTVDELSVALPILLGIYLFIEYLSIVSIFQLFSKQLKICIDNKVDIFVASVLNSLTRTQAKYMLIVTPSNSMLSPPIFSGLLLN
jgi:hypothetical protein